MYFDDCQEPAELQRAISEFMKIQTGRRVSLAGKGSVAVPLIDEHTDQTLREGVAEAYAAARKMRKTYQALPNVPGPSVVPLESLMRLSEWCDKAMRQMPEKPGETEPDTTPAKRGMFKRITVWIFKKTWRLIGAIIVGLIVAVLVIIFGDFGWIDQIKDFIYNILQLE